jgi:hypothetical protein
MDEATGEAAGMGLRVAFDRRLKLEFHGATVTSDAGSETGMGSVHLGNVRTNPVPRVPR